jgi:hypothetical protein
MHEEMMVGFRRRRTQSRSGWGTPRPPLVASDVVSSRLVAGPVAAAAIIGGAWGLTAVANAANPDVVNLNPRTSGTQFGVIVHTHAHSGTSGVVQSDPNVNPSGISEHTTTPGERGSPHKNPTRRAPVAADATQHTV